MLISDTRACKRCFGPSIDLYCRGCKEANRIAKNKSDVRYRRRLKLETINAYGGPICACKGCGITELEFLSIDHINGGGNAHRRLIGGGGTKMYQHLRNDNFPPGFRVLCSNCNQSLGAFGYCPHDKVNDLDAQKREGFWQ
jgi:hypothetical protein